MRARPFSEAFFWTCAGSQSSERFWHLNLKLTSLLSVWKLLIVNDYLLKKKIEKNALSFTHCHSITQCAVMKRRLFVFFFLFKGLVFTRIAGFTIEFTVRAKRACFSFKTKRETKFTSQMRLHFQYEQQRSASELCGPYTLSRGGLTYETDGDARRLA